MLLQFNVELHKSLEFLGHLRNKRLLKKHSAQWTWLAAAAHTLQFSSLSYDDCIEIL